MLSYLHGSPLPAREALRGSRYEAMLVRVGRSLLLTALLRGPASGSSRVKGCEADCALIVCNRTGLVFGISRAWHGANALESSVYFGRFFCKARSWH